MCSEYCSNSKNVNGDLQSSHQHLSIPDNLGLVQFRRLMDADWTMLFVTRGIQDIAGYPADEFIENQIRTYRSVIHQDDAHRVAAAIKEAFRAKQIWDLEYRIRHKDGQICWVNEKGRSVSDDTGNSRYLEGVIVDITKHKPASEQLPSQPNELEVFFSASLDLLCIANTNGQFLRLNPEWESVLGYTVSELEGSFFLEYVHPEDRTATLAAIADLADQNEIKTFVNRYRCKDGSYRWIEWRSKPKGDQIYAAARDITEHIEMQQRLAESERQYRLLAEGAADVVWTADLQLRTTWVSPSISTLTQETPEEHMGRTLEDRFTTEDIPRLRRILQEQLDAEINPNSEQNKAMELEIQHRKSDGSLLWIAMKMTFLRDESGMIVGIHGVSRDISHDKAMRETLLNSEERFRKLFYEVPAIAVQGYQADGAVVFWNKGSENVYGYTEDEALSKNLVDLIIPDPMKTTVQEKVRAMVEHKLTPVPAEELWLKHKDGRLLPVYSHHVVVNTANGQSELFCLDIDLREQKALQERLRLEGELFRTTLLSVGDGVISTDQDGNTLILNPIAEQLTGWTQAEAAGRPLADVFHIVNESTRERCDNPVHKVLATGEIVELANHTLLIAKDGTERPIEDSAAPIKNEQGNITGVVLAFRDFSEKKKQIDEVRYLTIHDHLTGLHNRSFFEAELERLDTERSLPLTIILADVNGLKLINDSFGHAVGDELLQRAATILRRSLREDAIVARVGGDECAVLLPRTNDVEAKRWIAAASAALKNEKIRDLDVSVSFGYETKHNATEPIRSVFKKAEDYMYNNKLFEGPSVRGRVISNIIATINGKSPREKAHSERVAELCVAMGEALHWEQHEIKKVKIFGLLHDIGKIAIADDVLNKPGALTAGEFKEMRRHAEIGYRILSTANHMSEMADCVLAHHERWDGNGYPRGLAGDSIPLFSRICGIADAYDAMTSDRSYRAAKSKEFAAEELRMNSGTQFDPELVKVFLETVMPNVDHLKQEANSVPGDGIDQGNPTWFD